MPSSPASDDPDHRQVVVGGALRRGPRRRSRRTASPPRRGSGCRRSRRHQHEDPGQPGVADEVRGFVDQRFGDRGEDEHRRQRYRGTVPARTASTPSLATRYRPCRMRVWIDLTNSPHVLVMRPVIERLRADGPRRAGDRARLRADARAVRAASASSTRRSAATAASGWPPRRAGLASRSAALVRWARRTRAPAGASTSRSATAPTT